jgi:hypothetical protein
MIVKTIDGNVYRMLNFTYNKFGKTFQKVNIVTGGYFGYPKISDKSTSMYISEDSIIAILEEDDEE